MIDKTALRPLIAGTVAVSLASAAMAVADPNLVDVKAHRHYIKNTNGKLTQVGPDLCDNASLQHAFNEFHNNVHRETDPQALGPAAPGLHNAKGAEIISGPC